MERDRTAGLAPPARLAASLAGVRSAARDRLGARSSSTLALAWRATWTSRAVAWVAGAAAMLTWGVSPRASGFDPARVTQGFGALGDLLVAPAARWDSVWFLGVAQHGYTNAGHTAFFPLYPLLVRAGGAVLGSPLVAGVLVSGTCTVVALAALHALTALELGDAAARWTVLAVAFSPMSFFLSAVYSEALFLALSVGAVLAARRDRWLWAGALGALAAATRSAGVVVLVALALLALAGRPRPPLRQVAALALVPVGLGAFLAALAVTGHDALAPFSAQQVWYRHWAGPFGGVVDGARAAWDGLRQLLSGQRAHVYFSQAGGDPIAVGRQNLMLFAFLLAAVPALVGAARRLPLAYVAYALTALALPLSEPVTPEPLMSLPRFELVLFPLWMWWGLWLSEHPRARRPALAVSAVLLAAFAAKFATWHWVA